METEGAGEEGASADETAGEEAAGAAAAEAGEGSGDRTTTLRPQERRALRRPPNPLPLLRSRAPRSPSPAPT